MSSKKHPPPSFAHHELKAGGGWYVVATWHNGRTQHIGGFATEAESTEWIKNDSAEWTRKHSDQG